MAAVLQPNIVGAINLWEGARKAGVDRVLFASSNHAIGLHRRSERIDHTAPRAPMAVRPLEGLRRGSRGAVCLQVGRPRVLPPDRHLLPRAHERPRAFELAVLCRHGAPPQGGPHRELHVRGGLRRLRNPRTWWDNSNVYRLGYDPQDNAEIFAGKLDGAVSKDPIEEAFQGGSFVSREFVGDPSRIP